MLNVPFSKFGTVLVCTPPNYSKEVHLLNHKSDLPFTKLVLFRIPEQYPLVHKEKYGTDPPQ